MRNFYWGIILIAFGMLFLLDNLDVADFSDVIRTYWPLLLILWGIGIVIKKKGYERVTIGSSSAESFEGDLFHKSNVFGDIAMNVTSQNYKGGSVSSVFGDCKVDLSKAAIADGEHWLRLHGVFGDIGVVVPKNMAFSVSANAVIGNVRILGEEKGGFVPQIHFSSPDYDSASRKLKLTVTQVFGDITVTQ